MTSTGRYDAVVVGAGPNGLAAAVVLAQSGKSVLVLEAGETVGGGVRSAELTLPGFVHDVCSTIYGLAAGSPFMKRLPLAEHGVEWRRSPAPLAHPLDGGTAVMLETSVEATSDALNGDGWAYRRLVGALASNWDGLAGAALAPISPAHLLKNMLVLGRFGPVAMLPSTWVAKALRGEGARALFAGLAGHSMLPLNRAPAGFPLLLAASAHATGWPVVRGGSQRLADGLASYLRSLGGEIVTGVRVKTVDDLPKAKTVLLDMAPKGVIEVAGHRLSAGYAGRLKRYRYGPGVFKIDWALDGPVPWTAPECARAAMVHLGGTDREIEESESAVWAGTHPERPFVLFAQPSLFDSTRAPDGKHTAWAYCHVPSGSTVDMTDRIEAQVERYAPGFRDLVLARHTRTADQIEAYNPNYVGGDINGGVQDLRQHFARPVLSTNPYATSAPGIYICSSATPPGGGVHGMCGFHAASAVLKRELRG